MIARAIKKDRDEYAIMESEDTIERLRRVLPLPKPGKKLDVKSGDLFYVDRAKFLPPLPAHIRSQVEEFGYTARYYDFPPVLLSSVIETFLSFSVKRGDLNEYNSSVKERVQLRGNLVYYAITHVIITPIARSVLGVINDDEDEIALIVIYSHPVIKDGGNIDGSVVLIAADDIGKYDSWVDKINEMYVQNKLPRMTYNG